MSEGKSKISEDDISGAIYTKDSPPLDMIVRTGGDLRISNFLLWEAAYAELYFTKTLWPDFSKKDVDKAIKEFNKRNRRFGGV
jgi:undecaprenyl diphosphate synthase